MNLTFGFIAFFVSIIIPGILFRRYYYYGEFSKQFHTKDPVLHSIFLSTVPGVCLQLIGFYFLSQITYFEIENIKVFNVFKDFAYLESKEIGDDTRDFLSNGLGKFILYSTIIFFFSAIIGNLTSRLLRVCNFDRAYKIFRFKNQWYYIFSGEVLKFQKFKTAKGLHFNKLPENQKVLMTFADILVSNPEGNRELYTGFVVDYDLNNDDISKLDKIYLLDAYRYKRPTNPNEFTNEKDHSRKRINIPGDLLIVSGEKILNINLTYIPSKKIIEKREAKKQKIFRIISYTLTTFTVGFILLHIFSNLLDFGENSILNSYFTKSTFWGHIFSIIYLNQLIALIFPVKSPDGKYYFSLKTTGVKILILMILSFILYYYIIKNQYICTPFIY